MKKVLLLISLFMAALISSASVLHVCDIIPLEASIIDPTGMHANLGWGPGSAILFRYDGGDIYDINYEDIYGRSNWIDMLDQQIITDIRNY